MRSRLPKLCTHDVECHGPGHSGNAHNMLPVNMGTQQIHHAQRGLFGHYQWIVTMLTWSWTRSGTVTWRRSSPSSWEPDTLINLLTYFSDWQSRNKSCWISWCCYYFLQSFWWFDLVDQCINNNEINLKIVLKTFFSDIIFMK